MLLHAAILVRHPLPLRLDVVVGDLQFPLRVLQIPDGAGQVLIFPPDFLDIFILLLALNVELQESLYAEDLLDFLYSLIRDVFLV